MRTGARIAAFGGFAPLIAGALMVLEENDFRATCMSVAGQFITAVNSQANAQCLQAESTWRWGWILAILGAAVIVGGIIGLLQLPARST